MPRSIKDPLRVFLFTAEFGSHLKGTFQECSVVSRESEVIEHTQVDQKGVTVYMAMPGKSKQGHITLKRAIIPGDNTAWAWRKLVEDGDIDKARCEGTITLRDYKGDAALEVVAGNCWPIKVSGPTPNAKGNEAAMEEIEIVCETLTRKK